jgi:AcrR family transcriptional regulator
VTARAPRSAHPARAEQHDRRGALVRAAYARIADKGFEGLRTRDVAADVGLNVATLHYYFPTKESLIRAVVGHAMSKFGAALPREGSAAQQLAGHFRAIRRLLRDEPELWAVLGELALRAPRDPEMAAIMRPTDQAWHARVRDMLAKGVEEGGIDAAIEPADAAAAIVGAIRGASLPGLADVRAERLDQTFRQLERWFGLPSTAP